MNVGFVLFGLSLDIDLEPRTKPWHLLNGSQCVAAAVIRIAQ